MPLLKPNWLKLLKLLSVLVMYMLTHQFVGNYLAPQGNASMFFIATGIAFAALLLGGRLYALSIFFGSLIILGYAPFIICADFWILDNI